MTTGHKVQEPIEEAAPPWSKNNKMLSEAITGSGLRPEMLRCVAINGSAACGERSACRDFLPLQGSRPKACGVGEGELACLQAGQPTAVSSCCIAAMHWLLTLQGRRGANQK